MQLTQEIPADRTPNAIGLSRGENDRFWRTVDRLNRIYYRSMNTFIGVFSAIICALLFMVRFEKVDLWYYLIMQTFHILHTTFFLFFFIHSVCSVNVLLIAVMVVLIKKFRRIARRVEALNARNAQNAAKLVNNRRLTRLLFEHNKTQLELLEMNAFFCRFVAVNLVHVFL